MEAEAPERLSQAEAYNWDMAAALQEAAPELWAETVGAFAQVSAYSAPDMTYDPLVAAAEATGVDPSTLRLDDLGSVRTTHLTVVSLSDFNGARALQGQDPVELAAGTCALANNMDMVTPLAQAVLDAAPTVTIAGHRLRAGRPSVRHAAGGQRHGGPRPWSSSPPTRPWKPCAQRAAFPTPST